MREQLETRRAELQAEYDRGLEMAAELDRQRATLEQTLLRIGGAIQVLGELLAAPQQEAVDNGNNS